METESCQYNQSSYLTGKKPKKKKQKKKKNKKKKKPFLYRLMLGTCMQSISFIKQTVSEEKIFSSPEPKAHKVSL